MAPKSKMSREDRAKQFMPFAALKGYEEALREKERIIVPKIELSEDMKEELDRRMHHIKEKTIVIVVFYSGEVYEKKMGMVSKLDTSGRYIKIVNTKIPFDDILDIRVEDSVH